MSLLCEPVQMPRGATARYTRVDLSSFAPPNAPLHHFHACGEIVLFEKVEGRFQCGDHDIQIGPGALVYVPPLAYHNFTIEQGDRAWRMVQFDADAAQASGAPAPDAAFVLYPEAVRVERVRVLMDWQGDPVAMPGSAPTRLAALLWDVASLPGATMAVSISPVEAFRPALARLHDQPGARLSLSAAAALCGLSPAHFSRRFSEAFGQGYADYVMALRLNIASRRLIDTHQKAASIAYETGFASPAHFSARFRKRFGVTPSRFRLSARQAVTADTEAALTSGGR